MRRNRLWNWSVDPVQLKSLTNLLTEQSASDFTIVCDDARIENPVDSLQDSMASLESIKFTTSPVLEADEERKAIKNISRWEEEIVYPAFSIRRPEKRIFRSSSDGSPRANRCTRRPPACPRRQISNESVGSMEEYRLLNLQQANEMRRKQGGTAAEKSTRPTVLTAV